MNGEAAAATRDQTDVPESDRLPPISRRDWIRSAVDRFEGPLTIYACRLLGDVDRARDVVQDTFMKLWQADRQTVDGHLAKWLYTVCRNRALDVRRKERRVTTFEERELETAAPPASASAIGARPGGEPAGGVAGLVAALPARQQEAVRLKFQGDLSYKEIAEVMNTTVNNVGVLLHTAIKSIRGRIDGLEPGDSSSDVPRVSAAR